jgi:CBS domain-containing protein
MSENDDDWTADDESVIDNGPAVELFMGESVPMVAASTTIREAAACLREAEVGLLVVGTADAVQGVVSERDIVRCVALGIDLDSTTVEAVESEDLKWATRDSSVAEVVEEMMEHYLRHVLIAGDDGRLVGVASMRDLIAAFLD